MVVIFQIVSTAVLQPDFVVVVVFVVVIVVVVAFVVVVVALAAILIVDAIMHFPALTELLLH